MKYEEFKEAVKHLELTITEDILGNLTVKRYDTVSVLVISNNTMYKFSILHGFYDLNDIDKTILYDLVTKYAKTPLEERKELTRYYVKHNFLKDDWNYLNYYTDEDEYLFSTLYNTCSVQTKFTQKEIDYLPMWIRVDLRDGKLKKVKVEEELEC